MVPALCPFTARVTALPAWSLEATVSLEQLHREKVTGPPTESLRVNCSYTKYRAHNAPCIQGLPYGNFYIMK